MRLRRLEVENFRGVKALNWRNIAETAGLVGPGDSGKPTILDANERVFSPKWNDAFDDTDFCARQPIAGACWIVGRMAVTVSSARAGAA